MFILGGPFRERAFSGSDFGQFVLQKTPKFGPSNCHTNNFLHYEFQLSMLSSSKISQLGGPFFGGEGSSRSLRTAKFGPNNFLHYEFQLSMSNSLKISLWEGHFWGAGVCPLSHKGDSPSYGGSPNLLQIIVPQTTSYIISFNFLC